MTERDLTAELNALGKKLDRLTYLLVALLVLQLFDVFGLTLVNLSLIGLFALVQTFVFLVLLGLARSF